MQSRLKRNLLQTTGGQFVVLTAAMLSLYAAAAVIAWLAQGLNTLGIAVVLALVCYASALIALFGERFFSERRQALLGLYWAMMIRSGVPLLAVMMMKVLGGPFAEPPAVCYLITFYFGALIVQVVLSYLAADEQPSAVAHIRSK